MPRIQFRNDSDKAVYAALKRRAVNRATYHRVEPGASRSFTRDTGMEDNWIVQIARERRIGRKRAAGRRLHTVRKLHRDAVVTLNARGEVSTARPANLGNATIDHVVVLMLENRSFDNLLGWMYEGRDLSKLNYVPCESDSRLFDGLKTDTYWNADASGDRLYASKGTTGKNGARWVVPDPDPREQFRYMNQQQFSLMNPPPGKKATMKGFFLDYAGIEAVTRPEQIMQSYAPAQVPVLTALARQYAVCDRWFASAPCQTWPNRSFVHAGTSNGRINNLDGPEDSYAVPSNRHYDVPTIFDFLQKVGASWHVYSGVFSLTDLQFARRFARMKDAAHHFKWFAEFKLRARRGKLPRYSFIEPTRWLVEPNDQHPPHDVRAAEKLIKEVYDAVSNGKAWENTLLIVTYDEHGGCYDHVPPPRTAEPPDDAKPQQPPVDGIDPFRFDRYGVRVPTVLINPHIKPSTVLRKKPNDREFDHASILATLRDWLDPECKTFPNVLRSRRIKKAPTLAAVMQRETPRGTLPRIPDAKAGRYEKARVETALNPIQRAMVATGLSRKLGVRLDPRILERHGVTTIADARRVLGRIRC